MSPQAFAGELTSTAVGWPRLKFAPVDGQPIPAYFIYPVDYPDHPGPEFQRVAASGERGHNPNVFIRRDDPHAAHAEVLEP
jgi:hypothetical protein